MNEPRNRLSTLRDELVLARSRERYTRRVPVSPAWMELMGMTFGTEALVSFRSRSAKSSPDLRGTQNSARPFLLAFAGGGGYLAVNSHAEARPRACRRVIAPVPG